MKSAPDFTGARWFKSSSSGDGGCVEVAILPAAVGIRDSKTANGPVLVVSRESWAQFVTAVQADEFSV